MDNSRHQLTYIIENNVSLERYQLFKNKSIRIFNYLSDAAVTVRNSNFVLKVLQDKKSVKLISLLYSLPHFIPRRRPCPHLDNNWLYCWSPDDFSVSVQTNATVLEQGSGFFMSILSTSLFVIILNWCYKPSTADTLLLNNLRNKDTLRECYL